MNALQSLIKKEIEANPLHAGFIKMAFQSYIDGELENVMVGDLEEADYFIANLAWNSPEQKAWKKFSNAVYKFHRLDNNGYYVNQDNHYKVYGYYEDVTVDHICSYNKIENQDYTNPLFFPN